MQRTTRFRVHNHHGICKLYEKETGTLILTATPIMNIQEGPKFDGFIILPVTYMGKGDGIYIPASRKTYLYGINFHNTDSVYNDRLYAVDITHAIRNVLQTKVSREVGFRYALGSCSFYRGIHHRILQNGNKRYYAMTNTIISNTKWLRWCSDEFRNSIWPWYLENRTQYHRI